MARHKDSILSTQNRSINLYRDAPMANLALGGQNGWRSDLRYFHSNTDHIERNLIFKVLEAPAAFMLLENGQDYITALKAVTELYAQVWSGFNKGLEVESATTPVGGAGEQQHTPSNVTRTPSVPVMEVPDKYGRPIQNLLEFWITQLIMDPDTKIPGIATMEGVTMPADWLPNYYTMTALAFVPDATFTKVDKAWLMTNMYPTSTGEIIGRRDKTQAGQLSQLSITWTGIQQVGLGPRRLAQALLDEMVKTGTSPNQAPAFIEAVDADVLNSAYGFSEKLAEANQTFIRP